MTEIQDTQADDWSHMKPYGYAPGGYMSRCCRCNETFSGADKRAFTCRTCAEKLLAAALAAPAPQAAADPDLVATLQRDLARAQDSANGFVAEIKMLQQHIRELRAFQAMVNRHAPEFPADPDAPRDVWYWQGDGQDRLESMVHQLPIVIRAEQLRELLAAPTGAAPADPDGEAFRTAAHLGLTLRFDGGCAQSATPGTPSAYEVVNKRDRAEGMRQAVSQAAAVIAAGGQSPKDSMAKLGARDESRPGLPAAPAVAADEMTDELTDEQIDGIARECERNRFERQLSNGTKATFYEFRDRRLRRFARALIAADRAAIAQRQQHQAAEAEAECKTWRALCEFLLAADEPMAFLRAWNEGNFDACKREWPEAPASVYPTSISNVPAQPSTRRCSR